MYAIHGRVSTFQCSTCQDLEELGWISPSPNQKGQAFFPFLGFLFFSFLVSRCFRFQQFDSSVSGALSEYECMV